LNKLQKDFEAEQVILPENLRKKREEEIARRQTILQDLQRTRFGFEGDLFKKRQELIKPVQDKVYNDIQKLAIEKQYDINVLFTRQYIIPEIENSDECNKFKENRKSDAPLNLWATRKGYEIYYDFFRVKNLDTNSVELVFTILLNIYKKLF
jgi:hypothetical protein